MAKAEQDIALTDSNLPKTRQSQAERSAITRSKLISASIACLSSLGYSETSNAKIAKKAGLSLGAMTHQFPTKEDLMSAVVRSVFDSDLAHYRRNLKTSSGRPALEDLIGELWKRHSAPAGVAVMEIMLAARSSENLAQKLSAMQAEIEIEARKLILERLNRAKVIDRSDGLAIHRLVTASIRGLVLDQIYRGEKAEVAQSLAALTEVIGLLYPRLLETD